jgi:hypothetical protein
VNTHHISHIEHIEWDQWNGGATLRRNWNGKQKQRAPQILFLKFLPDWMRVRVTRIANQRCESKINTRNAHHKGVLSVRIEKTSAESCEFNTAGDNAISV